MKSKKYRFSCPLCGWLSWQNKLNNHHDLEVVEIRSGGRGKIENIFLEWGSVKSLSRKFKSHFYNVLRYLLRKEYIDARIVKEVADVYLLKSPDVLHAIRVNKAKVVRRAKVVRKPMVIS